VVGQGVEATSAILRSQPYSPGNAISHRTVVNSQAPQSLVFHRDSFNSAEHLKPLELLYHFHVDIVGINTTRGVLISVRLIGGGDNVVAAVIVHNITRDANNQVNQSICLIPDHFVARDTVHAPYVGS
jgi:hypothetical protein